ncbi:MAG: hypothetical protein JW850_11140 [Thermoflexales bacterium]|nr:hypothetical protein [Thermoflexales bacterium]
MRSYERSPYDHKCYYATYRWRGRHGAGKADYPFRLHAIPDAPQRIMLNGTQAFSMGALAGGCRRATPGPTFEALDPVLQEGPPLVKRPLEKLAPAQVESLLAGLR